MKQPLFGKSLEELLKIVADLSFPSYTAGQIAGWLYRKQASSVGGMTDLSVKFRNLLDERYIVGLSDAVAVQTSKDGTKKYLFPVSAGRKVETVYIPEDKRATLCLSSQAGCRMACRFCITGKQGMNGNLTSTDVLNQLRSLPERALLTNIVFMGMGEPLDNQEEVMKSVEILTSDYGYGWSPKRITVSTVGILPALGRFMERCRCHLAVSLHHPGHEERKKLIPAENRHPVKEIVALLKTFDLNRQRRVSFEYLMLSGINDSQREAREVVRLLSGLRCRVNLIPYHAGAGSEFIPSNGNTIQAFAETLRRKGLTVTIRQSRGFDIDAACGMLTTVRE
ncbi:MAG: 23S rRNA (adenine(2503)-C(2))-methyltransferase RlmN [Bacteroidales bacterium]|jgi:23S rRNA (adenine2503-C2)-methyltransferase|nr:23S rRNA (adenine(2503)-C(2))-methyltransferase RlmN [Bacteroidales bacterium]